MLAVLKFQQGNGASITSADQHGALLSSALPAAVQDVPEIAVSQAAAAHEGHEKHTVQHWEAFGRRQGQQVHAHVLDRCGHNRSGGNSGKFVGTGVGPEAVVQPEEPKNENGTHSVHQCIPIDAVQKAGFQQRRQIQLHPGKEGQKAGQIDQ